MILTDKNIKDITDEDGVYRCSLLKQHFAYKLLKENVSPLGDVICFTSPSVIGPLGMSESLIIVGELPNTNMFGAACFQRLYASQLGTILSTILGKDNYIEDSCIFVEDVQASLTILNQVKDSVIFHIAFPITIDPNILEHINFYQLKLNEEQLNIFKYNAVECFKYLIHNIFIETRRDNF